MNLENEFRKPVFVREDDTTTIEASVVVWKETLGGVSVRLYNGNESVFVNAADWLTLVGCINREIERVL